MPNESNVKLIQKGHIPTWEDMPFKTTTTPPPPVSPVVGEIVVNKEGGKQSFIEGQMTEVPPIALREVARVMELGRKRYPREKDGTPNWHKISCNSNLDHALEHILNYLDVRNKPYTEGGALYMREELSHFAARALMALEQFIRGKY